MTIPKPQRSGKPARGIASLLLAVSLVAGCQDRPGVTQVPEPVAPEESATIEVASLPQVQFVEITEEVGIDFIHHNAAAGEKLLPETMGSGVAAFDYDSDGDPDLLFLNQAPWPETTASPDRPPTQALYRNDGTGQFDDVTEEAGLDLELFAQGAVTGDYDNDGDPDLYITTVNGGLLFRNDDGKFTDVTEAANARGGNSWQTSGAFFDLENDGDLDLFLCVYVEWNRDYDLSQSFQLTGEGRHYGSPQSFQGDACVLLRNEGNGTFTEISEAAGVQIVTPELKDPMAKSLGVAPWDIDSDGFVDLAVANDTVRNFLFRNQGDGTFEEVGIVSGIAFDQLGQARGAMGIDWAYFRGDDAVALAIANFANEMTALYVADNPSRIQFTDLANVFGLGAPTQGPLKFGLFFFDYDLDGRLDLLTVNGHLESDIEATQASQQYQQPAQLFWNSGILGPSLFTLVSSEQAGPDLFTPIVGRGSVYADFDADGDLDLAVTSNGEPARVFRNDGGNENHWVRIRLRGRKSNRDGLGAKLEVAAGDLIQRRQHFLAKGYLSSVEETLTFGLGDRDQVDSIRVEWPSGMATELSGLDVNRTYVIDEIDGILE